MTTNTVTLGVVETTSSSYPTLTQQNLHTTGKIYQMPIAKYSKTTTSLTLQSLERTFIETPLSVANSGYSRALTYIDNFHSAYNWKGDWYTNTTTCHLTENQYKTYPDTMFVIHVSCGVTVCIPGRFISATSNFMVEYAYGGTSYMITCSSDNDEEYVSFKLSNTSHYIRTIYGVR